MNHVLLFKTDDGEHPLEIIDRNSDRWVSRSQLGNALGVGNLRPLHSRLAERGELRQGLHWRNESLPRPDKNGVTRHREMVIYSYRGVIRVAMHSEGLRAMAFRDWAETVLYDVMTTGGYTSGYTQTDRLNSLRRMAEDDTALEKMFRKRKTGLMEIGFDRSVATRKAIESIRRDTGIDLSERWGFDSAEPEESQSSEEVHKNTGSEPGKLHTADTTSESEIPKSYRGWNLNRRGKNKKGQILFNLAKKIGGKKRQKYLGIWNRDKADRIIDEMSRKYKSELQTPS